MSKTAWFITLTYQDNYLTLENGVAVLVKKDVQDFLKRLRFKLQSASLKYYCVGEYGGQTKRPHYHMILFNLDLNELQTQKILLETWQKGMVHVGTVTEASIGYTLKYMVKEIVQNEEFTYQKPFALMSKQLGSNYLNTHQEYHGKNVLANYYTVQGGGKRRLPRYLRERLYNEGQRMVQKKEAEKRAQNGLPESLDFFKDEIETKVNMKRSSLKQKRLNEKL